MFINIHKQYMDGQTKGKKVKDDGMHPPRLELGPFADPLSSGRQILYPSTMDAELGKVELVAVYTPRTL